MGALTSHDKSWPGHTKVLKRSQLSSLLSRHEASELQHLFLLYLDNKQNGHWPTLNHDIQMYIKKVNELASYNNDKHTVTPRVARHMHECIICKRLQRLLLVVVSVVAKSAFFSWSPLEYYSTFSDCFCVVYCYYFLTVEWC